MTAVDPIVIVGAKRTPMGGFQGELKDLSATDLGGAAIKAALEDSGVKPGEVDEVLMGCVLPAGLGQAPARQAALNAGVPDTVWATTVNKMCGSGMKAAMQAHDGLAAGSFDIAVAGGLESMTNAPYLLDKARSGQRMGHGRMIDHMFYDGLEDSFDHKGKLMGWFAEQTARHYQFTREAMDEFAIRSLSRAKTAGEDGTFDAEVTPVTIKTRKGEVTVTTDEQPRTANPDKIPTLKPAFDKDGSVTAANSSSISDGAAAVVMMRRSVADKRGLRVLAEIKAHATNAHAPEWFTTAPVGAIAKILDKTGWTAADVDLFEVNEAFAAVTMAAMHEHNIPAEKINIHGGACALGHPVGASGARILVTLLNALAKHDLKRGVASLCLGGGEAVAVAVERVAA